ncbi:hypothetical protein A0H81_03952 [Grifola frondosa]|uniref:Uncharacterized protein n=1 Tax=Grifola frondosa TaxID=5627 RepID=A0A1C7MJL8_GRIFR|nr:hypothetical protein A0H81_03952 [Grifola frondosa]
MDQAPEIQESIRDTGLQPATPRISGIRNRRFLVGGNICFSTRAHIVLADLSSRMGLEKNAGRESHNMS